MDESANWYQNIWTHSTIHSIKDLPSQLDLKRITANTWDHTKVLNKITFCLTKPNRNCKSIFAIEKIISTDEGFPFYPLKTSQGLCLSLIISKINIYRTSSATTQHTTSNYNTAQQTITVHIKLRHTTT